MTESPINVLVAGVPHGLERPFPDGRWLTPEHVAQIEGVSPRVQLTHLSGSQLDAGDEPPAPPEVMLIETSGSFEEWEDVPGIVRGKDFRRLITPSLRWVQGCSHGVEQLLSIVPSEVLLTSGKGAGGVHAMALAESVLGAMLFHARRLADRIARQRQHVWEPLECDVLNGQTVCILGTGSIGTAVARLAEAFGMEVIGVRRKPGPADNFHKVVGPKELLDVLPQSKFLVVTCPITEETRGMVGQEEFNALPSGAHLSVVSRGEVVQKEALLEALSNDHLGGAFLDSHDPHPLPPDYPLWDMPKVLITPHDSHASPYIGDRNVEIFCENLRRYVAGETLDGLVDREAGY